MFIERTLPDPMCLFVCLFFQNKHNIYILKREKTCLDNQVQMTDLFWVQEYLTL